MDTRLWIGLGLLGTMLVAGAGLWAIGPTDPVNSEPTANDYQFTEVSQEVGIEYESVGIGAVNGNDGVYTADYTNNLRTDILVIGGGDPVLFENSGDEYVVSEALPQINGTVQAALFFDHDNDGWEDLLVLRRGDTPVFLENRGGSFTKENVGFSNEFAVPVAATAADATGDGHPDVFIVNYDDWLDEPPRGWQGDSDFPPIEDNGASNVLYTNQNGSFERTESATVDGDHWSMSASFTDLTGDGHPDIHVANDYDRDEIHYNDGTGSFTSEYLGPATDRNGMSSRAVDVLGDGQPELFVTNIHFPNDRWGELPDTQRQLFVDMMTSRIGDRNQGNNLLVRTEDGFEDQGEKRGLNEGGWGWGTAVEDFNNNGQTDILHSTQYQGRFAQGYPRYTRSMLFAQDEGEFTRINSSELGFEEVDERGVAAVDYSTNGRMDVAIAGNNARYRLYENNAPHREALQVVVGGASMLNHTTLGTTVELETEDTNHRQVRNAKSDYQSQGTRTLHFGLDAVDSVEQLRVTWPDGTERAFENIETGQRVLVTPDGIETRQPFFNDEQ